MPQGPEMPSQQGFQGFLKFKLKGSLNLKVPITAKG
jgi:hypothetical protein